MRFLVDECTGPAVARWLREHHHEVFSVYDEARGMHDEEIIRKAFDENWILITNDRDFGELVFKQGRPHRGVIFLRLIDERASNKIETMRRLLSTSTSLLPDRFVVVTETQIRFARTRALPTESKVKPQ